MGDMSQAAIAHNLFKLNATLERTADALEEIADRLARIDNTVTSGRYDGAGF